MRTTHTTQRRRPEVPPEPVGSLSRVEELYGAFMDAWRVHDVLEARRQLGRCRQAIARHCSHDERLVELARRCESLLEARQSKGECIDDELAHELVELRHAMAAHLA